MLKWGMNCMGSNKNGSISIEVSIVLSVLLVLITMMITAMNIQKTDLYMQASIEQATEDLAILGPFTRITDEVANVIFNDEDVGDSAKEAYSSLMNLTNVLNGISGYDIGDSIFSNVLSEKLRDDIAYEFINRTDSRNLYTPETIDVQLIFDFDNRIIEVYVSYGVNTVFGVVNRSHYSIIPFYGVINSYEFEGDDSNEMGEIANPWELSNFDRGRYFNEVYGGNLPNTFPVIDGYSDGTITSIVSMDLTRNTYDSKNSIESKILKEMEGISSFDGADVNIRGEQYKIESDDIENRELIIVVPSNSPAGRLEYLTTVVENYPNSNFNVTIITSGESK